jgi:hypothetical protein
MADSYYGDEDTITAVITDSGAKPTLLGLDTDDELETKITTYLEEAKRIIDSDRSREGITVPNPPPDCVVDIGLRIAVNITKQAILNHTQPFERVSEYVVRIQDNAVFTDELKARLDACLPKPDKSSILAYATR